MIPEKYKNTCPLNHSTFEKFIECDCNWGDPVEVWYFKEQQLAKLKEENEKYKWALEKIIDLHGEDGSLMQRYAYDALDK